MFTVIESFQPYRKGDLLLNEGDQVDKVKDIGHGWLLGRNVTTGKKGAFPEGCVDRDTTVTGALTRKFSKKSKSTNLKGTPKVIVLEGKSQQSEDGYQYYKENFSSSDLNMKKDDDTEKNDDTKHDGSIGGRWYMLQQRATSIQYKVLESPDDQHRSLKILARILCSVVASGVLYLLLFYSFGFDIAKAGYIVIGMFIFLILGFIFSSFLRCVILIMIPSLFTGRGKAIFLSVITGLLLSGPAMNILYNTEEVSESLGCTADLIYNQTRALRKQLEEPLRQLAAKLLYYMGNLREVVTSVREAIQPVTDAMKVFSDTVENAIGVVQNIANNCENGITSAQNECKKGVASAKSTCQEFIDRYDPTNFFVDGVNIFLGLFRGRKRRALNNSTLIQLHPYFTRSLVKRGVVKGVCEVFEVGTGICDLVGVFTFACEPFRWLSNIFKNVTDEILTILRYIENFFTYTVVNSFDVTGTANASKNFSTVAQEIKADLFSKVDVVINFFATISNLLSLSLLLLFLKSLLYVKKYRTKDHYDNRYITSTFMEYDADCKRRGASSVLPLRRREVSKYIFTTSRKLSMTEVSKLKKSIVTFLYHIIITTVIITFDHLIYYVLKLIQQYADVALTVEGVNTIDIEVEGKGFFTNFVRAMVSTINLNSTYSVDFNFTTCLPNPRRPNVSSIPGIVILYALALCFLFMQAYGYRLRRKIASVFYPEQENCRISYLHAKILHKRTTFAAFLKELVFRRRKEQELRNHITLRGLLSQKIPWLTKTCHWILPDKKSCHGCDIRARQELVFVKCQNRECKALFCQECFDIMSGQCFVCDKKH